MRRRMPTPGEAKAMAHEEKQRVEKLKSEGLCVACGDSPANPHLASHVCLSCWNEERPAGCMVKGCPNSTAGHFRQGSFCEVHLSNTTQEAYKDYLKLKSEAQELQQELEVLIGYSGYDPREGNKNLKELSPAEQSAYDKLTQLKATQRDMKFLKKDIKSAMNELDQVFPDNYEVFA